MAKMVKIRETIAAIVAIVLVFVLILGLSVVFDWNIPVLRDIADAIGISRE